MRMTIAKTPGLIELSCLLIVFWALGATVFLQFFSRYFLNMPLGWTEELARYLLIGVCFLGLPVVTRRGEHISIEVLVDALPPRARFGLELLADAIQTAIVAVLAFQAFKLAQMSMQSMSSMPFPKSIVYYSVLAGLVLQIGACLLRLAMRALGQDTPKTVSE